MSVYRTQVDLSAVTAYPGANSPSVVIPFVPKRVAVLNEHGSIPTFVSLDGTTDALRQVPGQASAAWDFGLQAPQKLWLKSSATGTGVFVQVVAES